MNLDTQTQKRRARQSVMVRGQVAKLGTGGADKATSWCVSVAVAFVLAFALQ